MEQYSGNSHSSIGDPTKKTAPTGDRPTLEAVVTGVVTRRKKPLGQRLKETFFVGELDGLMGHLFKEVLIPSLREAATDFIKQGIDRAVFGEVRPGSARRMGSPVQRTNYQTTVNRPSSFATNVPGSRRPLAQPSTFDFDQVVLDSMNEAQIVAELLHETVREYGSVSVANLYEALRETPTSIDHKWGWTDLEALSIRRVRNGYVLDFPPLEDLDR